MVLRLIEEGRPLDEIIWFDTGWEFPENYQHIDLVESRIGIPITRLHPDEPFEYMMLHKPVTKRSGENKGQTHKRGYGWPSWHWRWCTAHKRAVIRRHIRETTKPGELCGQYIGFALDERKRAETKAFSKPEYVFPLIEWGMTEADCLEYCRARGYTFGGIYEHFSRLSCWCCPIASLDYHRTLRREFPHIWARMIEWDAAMSCDDNRTFSKHESLEALDARFAREDDRWKIWG